MRNEVLNTRNHQSTNRNRRPAMTAKEVDQLCKDYISRKSVMTKRQMYKYEDAILHSNRTDNFGQARRTALAVLTLSAKRLMRTIEKDRDSALAFACAEDVIADYSKSLKEMSELVDEAHRRLIVALCGRPDMAEIMQAARRMNAPDAPMRRKTARKTAARSQSGPAKPAVH